MPNVKGPLADQNLKLIPWQALTIANLFGFVERGTTTRLFRQASCSSRVVTAKHVRRSDHAWPSQRVRGVPSVCRRGVQGSGQARWSSDPEGRESRSPATLRRRRFDPPPRHRSSEPPASVLKSERRLCEQPWRAWWVDNAQPAWTAFPPEHLTAESLPVRTADVPVERRGLYTPSSAPSPSLSL